MADQEGDQQAKVEVEVAIRDMFSTTLKQMGRELDNVNKKAQELGRSGAGSFEKFREQNERLNDHNKKTGASLVSVGNAVSFLTKSLIGPVGLAAGFGAVSKALEDVAVHAVQLRTFAVNTGFATTSVRDMQQAMRRLGMSSEESLQVIGNLGGKLNNLAAFKEGSDLYQALVKSPGGAGVAAKLLEIEKTGDRMATVTEILKVFNRQTREGKIALSQYLDTPIAVLEGLSGAMARNLKMNETTQADAQKYLDIAVDFEVKIGKIWKDISNHALEGMNNLSEAFASQGTTLQTITKFLTDQIDKTFSTIKETMKEINDIKAWWDNPQRGFPKLLEEKKDYKLEGKDTDPMGSDYTAPETLVGKVHGWLGRRTSGSSGSNLSATDFSGRQRKDEEGVELLRDVRDTLQRIETKSSPKSPPAGGAQNDSGDSGSGTGALGGALQASRGGFRPGTAPHGAMRATGGGFRPSRASHADTGETPAGSGPAEAGIASTNRRSVAGVMAEEWRRAGMSEKGIAGIMANVQDESRFNPTLRHPDQPRFSGEAHFAHGLYQEGGTEWNNYKKWLDTNYPNADWKDPRLQSRFAAERLKSGYSKTWRQMNEATTGGEAGAAYVDGYLKPAAGFRNERMSRYRRGVPGVEHYTGPLPTAGNDAATAGADRAAMDQRKIDDDANRAMIDKTQAAGKDPFGKINASVEFLNVPPGVKTNADTDGDIFKNLQISKTKQSGIYRQEGQAYD